MFQHGRQCSYVLVDRLGIVVWTGADRGERD
jgi:hypothetical protein